MALPPFLSVFFMNVFNGLNGALLAYDKLNPKTQAFLCFVAGLVAALALEPVSIPFFFFLGFGFFYFTHHKAQNGKQTFFYSWLFALGFHGAGLYWISASLFIDINKYFWVLPFSLLALPCYLAFLFAACVSAIHGLKKHGAAYALLLACAILASEVLRSFLLGGFPWNLFGYIWTQTDLVIQSASLFGIFGLTLLTLLVATLLAETILRPTPRSLVAFTSVAILFSGLALWGEQQLKNEPTFVPAIQLRVVQGAIEQAERRTQAQRMAAFSRYISLSTEHAKTPPTHIIWPETAAPFFLGDDDVMRKALSRIIPKGGALLTGSPSKDIRDGDISYFNSFVVLDDKGTITGRYDKSHLVPFGEFIPLRSVIKALPVAADIIGARDFSFGTGPRTLRAPEFPPFSTMICYEAIFSKAITDESNPPQLLLHVTNDAWFGNTSGPYQHFAMARVRAIEEGLPLVRAANTGISAVVDAYGRIHKKLDLGERGVIDAPLPTTKGEKTIYSQYGFVPVFILTLLISALCTMVLLRHKK